jgi:hypothetical protein
MRILTIVCVILSISCGRGSKGKSGGNGSDGDDVESGDQVVVTSGGSGGSTGATGAKGETGAQGEPGEPGTTPAIGLYDNNNNLVGYKFNDSDTADVFLTDGKHALIDMDTGALKPLTGFTFFCLYTSNDCSGQCYVYDRKWLNTLVLDNTSQIRIAARGTANEGAQTMNSYTREDAICVASTIGTVESYKAEVYNTTMQIPFDAPLYWGLEE